MRASLSRVDARAPAWIDGVFAARVRRAAAAIGPAGARVNVAIVNDRVIRRMNRRYRGKDRSTDVLSFSYRGAGGTRGAVIGDIAVSHQTLARDARRMGVDARDLAVRIVVHGFLHVLGYDHERSSDAARMERRERAVLRRVLSARVVRGLFPDD